MREMTGDMADLVYCNYPKDSSYYSGFYLLSRIYPPAVPLVGIISGGTSHVSVTTACPTSSPPAVKKYYQ